MSILLPEECLEVYKSISKGPYSREAAHMDLDDLMTELFDEMKKIGIPKEKLEELRKKYLV